MKKITAAAARLVRQTLLAAPIVMVPALSSVVMTSAGFEATSGVVYAQETAKKKPPPRKTRKTPALSQKVYKKLEVVDKLTNPEEDSGIEPDYRAALLALDDINTSKWNKYELANFYQRKAFAHYSLENYKEAIKYFRLVLKQSPSIPVGLEVQITYTVAQLQFVLEDYASAAKTLEQWMKIAPIVGADAYVLLGQAYYQIDQKKKALPHIEKAVKMYDAKGKVPKENWFQLLQAIYFDQNRYKDVINILTRMVRLYPKVNYWRQLSGMYGQVGREEDQLYAMDAVYVMGGLKKERELLNLAYMYLGQEVPYKAAKIMQKGMDKKVIERTSKNLEVLAQALQMSREIKKAIPVLEAAASSSGKGELYARLSNIYLDSDNPDKAIEVGNKALEKGKVKRMDQLYITMGMANANKKRYTTAIKYFEKAAKDKRAVKFAKGWIKFCQAERERERKLKAS